MDVTVAKMYKGEKEVEIFDASAVGVDTIAWDAKTTNATNNKSLSSTTTTTIATNGGCARQHRDRYGKEEQNHSI